MLIGVRDRVVGDDELDLAALADILLGGEPVVDRIIQRHLGIECQLRVSMISNVG